ncbi:HalOD1 output domain-containing protein [Haladaptatus sp. NG-WS-4]
MERTSYCLQEGEAPSVGVVNAIADHEGRASDGVEKQLYDVIDPDALDALFGPRADGEPRNRGKTVFTYGKYRITYESDGWIHVVDDTADSTASGTTPADE